MHKSEVVSRLGPAQDKIEREAKREELWIYPELKVIFHEGKLITWLPIDDRGMPLEKISKPSDSQVEATNKKGSSSETRQEVVATVEPEQVSLASTKKKSGDTGKILHDILQALPSQQGESTARKNSPTRPGMQNSRPLEILKGARGN